MQNEMPHIGTVLLTKFILGEVSAVEQMQVIEWLDADTANQEEFDRLEQVWLQTGDLKPTPLPIDLPKAWEKLDHKIDNYEASTKSITSYVKPVIYAVASIVLIVLLITILKPSITPFEPITMANLTGSTQTDTLPDGSIVTLNQFSKLTYHSKTSDSHRYMELEGEAFFDVVRDTLRPFIIKAGMGGIRVLGTSFNVRVSNTTDVTVDVKTGLVELFYPVISSNDTLRLKLNAGERGILSHQQKQIFSKNASPSSLFWMNNTLIFKNKPLKDVFEVLAKCYNVNILCDDNNINYYNLSTTFSDKEVNDVLDVIAATFEIKYHQEGNTYRFYRP